MHLHTSIPFAAVLLSAVLAAPASAQNLFKERRTSGQMTDPIIAREVGDILTVVISERHRIRNEDTVERSNETVFNARLDQYTLTQGTFAENVLPNLDVRQLRSFDGEATQEKDSAFDSRMSVVVIDRLPNGVLVVAGTRMMQIDDETKTLRISGLVRPFDITQANQINSWQVADARLSITGEGGNTRVTSRGPVAALFDTLVWIVWPF